MRTTSPCRALQPDLIAAASGEAAAAAAGRVAAHVEECASCRDAYARYREVETAVGALRSAAAPVPDANPAYTACVVTSVKGSSINTVQTPWPVSPKRHGMDWNP